MELELKWWKFKVEIWWVKWWDKCWFSVMVKWWVGYELVMKFLGLWKPMVGELMAPDGNGE